MKDEDLLEVSPIAIPGLPGFKTRKMDPEEMVKMLFGATRNVYPTNPSGLSEESRWAIAEDRGDHVNFWERDGRIVCMTSQPYKTAEEAQAEADFYRAQGFEVRVGDFPSWHETPSTILIEAWEKTP